MATLSLPKPVHNFAGEDELRQVNGHVAPANGIALDESNGHAEPAKPAEPERPSDRLKNGMIYPAKEMRGE